MGVISGAIGLCTFGAYSAYGAYGAYGYGAYGAPYAPYALCARVRARTRQRYLTLAEYV